MFFVQIRMFFVQIHSETHRRDDVDQYNMMAYEIKFDNVDEITLFLVFIFGNDRKFLE